MLLHQMRYSNFVRVSCSVPWLKLQPLIARKLESVIGEFMKANPGTDSIAGVNSDCVTFDEMHSRLINSIGKFNR